MTATTFPQRALKFLIPIFGSACIILPILIGLAHPKAMQASDFLMTFYPAGKLLVENRASDLYPSLNSISFVDSTFNVYTHQLMNALPRDSAAAYMYSPLTAISFVPFSFYDPPIALLCWQLVSLVALTVSAKVLSNLTGVKTRTTLFLFTLFFPVVQTIFIGQLGILLGILPLTIGFFLLLQNKEQAAGLVWSLLLFKPQFLPIAYFVALAFIPVKKFRCLFGLLIGLALLAALCLYSFGWEVLGGWLHCLQLASSIDSNPSYGYQNFMKCSLPASLLAFLPASKRSMFGPFVDTFVCLIAAHGIWTAMRYLRQSNAKNNEDQRTNQEQKTIIFLFGTLLIPLFQPHFFYYDLCVLAIAGALIFSNLAPFDSTLRRQTLIAWIIINLYLFVWMFVNSALAQPLIVVLVDGFIYWRVLQYAKPISSQYEVSPVFAPKPDKKLE